MIYIEFADKMTNGKFSKMNAKDKLQYIFDTEEGIDIPIQRQKDYHWLLRNFLIRNKKHPLADEVMNLLRTILRT